MARTLKAILLGMVALIALNVVAESASAATGMLTAERYPVKLTWEYEEDAEFQFGPTKVNCKKGTLVGEVSAGSKTITAHPAYSECTAFGFVGATVTTTGCDKDVLFGDTIASPDTYGGTVTYTCEAGKKIKISAGTCEVEIGPQSGLNGVTIHNITNATPKKDITIDTHVTGLAYTVSKDGFLCPLSGTGNFTDGVVNGAVTVFGEDPSTLERIGIWISD